MTKSAWTFLLVSLAARSAALYAATDAEVQSMRGLASVKVVVENVAEEVRKLGLSQEAMQTIAQAHLQEQYHITLEDSSPVFVYVKCRIVPPYKGMVAYDLSVQVRQLVSLNRDTNLQVVAATWEASGTFVTSERKFPSSVLQELENLLDKFGYDFLKANAK